MRPAGYLMRKVALDRAPLVLAFVLGNILETNFRQALLVGKVRWRCSIPVRSRPC